jgi:hypothetical protein
VIIEIPGTMVEEAIMVKIMDSSGRVLVDEPFIQSKKIIGMKEFSSGMYIMTVGKQNKIIYRQKVIVK